MTTDVFEQLDFVNENGRKALRHLGNELAFGNVVLFAGAGLSFNAPSKGGGANRMPGWNKLAEALLEQLEADTRDKWDVLKVADYYETAFGRKALIDKVMEAVRDEQHVPGRVHQCLAQLNLREIITTNYDTLIERAFRSLYVTPQVVVEGRDLVRRRQPPRIIKMNGCFERNPGNIVVTGNDFLSHSQRDPLIEVFVTKSFVVSQVLFIGFSLNDPAFRAINERVLNTLGKDCPVAFSLQLGAVPTETAYWRTRQVQVIDLKSGAPSDLSEEERIYLVMQALLQAQRARLAPVPHLYSGTSPFALFPTEDACADPAAVMHRAFPAIRRDALDAFLAAAPPDQPAHTGAVLLGRIFERAAAVSTQAGARARLATYLSAATGLSSSGEALVEGDKEWRLVWKLAALVIEAMKDEQVNGSADADLAVLCALFSLQFAVVAPMVSVAEADELLLAAMKRVTFDCLVSHDMGVRCRFLYLLLLFAPLDSLARLVDCWTTTQRERDVVDAGNGRAALKDARIEETPEEYRLPILSFFGVLQERPVFYKKAAESLWSREILSVADGSEAGRPRYEATLRYRYLLQLSREHATEWPGVHLHQERLERVLGSHALQSEPPAGAHGGYGESVQQMLTELARGWLFGSPDKVRFLKRTWQQVRTALKRGELQRAPLFATLIATLPIEGAHAVTAHHDVLEDAWHSGNIDLVALLRYIETRIGDAQFTRFTIARDGQALKKRPVGEYEEGLAALASWIVERIDEEGTASPLRDAAFVHLGESVLGKWLARTESDAARDYLTAIVLVLNRWDSRRTRPVYEEWLSQQLNGTPRGTLPLAELDVDGTLIADRDRTRLLLARARAQRRGDPDLRSDVERWLLRGADRSAVDDRLIAELATDVVDWMEREQATFGWIARAARICGSARLRTAVEAQPGIAAKGGLARYVIARLQSLPQRAAIMWPDKRSAYVADLAAFAPDLDAAGRRFLLDMLDPGALTVDGREGATLLAIRMIESDTDFGDAPEWATRLAVLLEHDATGGGILGGYVKFLPVVYWQKLETNLIVKLERRADMDDGDVVNAIAQTIAGSTDVTFADLELELCKLLTADHRRLAAAAAAALVWLLERRPEVVERNARHIARAKKVIESRVPTRGFRRSTAFVENLEKLVAASGRRSAVEGLLPKVPPRPRPPSRRRARST